MPLEGVLQGQPIDDGGEHPHVVGGRAIHAAGAGGEPAEDVAAADDDRGLHAERLDAGDVFGDARRDRGIDAVGVIAHQCFAGKLEKDAFVGRIGRVGHDSEL
jgi:hypothetical protein